MSDRIIIIEKGKIEQAGTPQEIYETPKSVFVADFIGESNILKGEISKVNKETIEVKYVEKKFTIPKIDQDEKGDHISLMIRPENVNISHKASKGSTEGIIKTVVYDGSITKLFIDTQGSFDLKITVKGSVNYKEGDKAYIMVDDKDIVAIRRNKQ